MEQITFTNNRSTMDVELSNKSNMDIETLTQMDIEPLNQMNDLEIVDEKINQTMFSFERKFGKMKKFDELIHLFNNNIAAGNPHIVVDGNNITEIIKRRVLKKNISLSLLLPLAIKDSLRRRFEANEPITKIMDKSIGHKQIMKFIEEQKIHIIFVLKNINTKRTKDDDMLFQTLSDVYGEHLTVMHVPDTFDHFNKKTNDYNHFKKGVDDALCLFIRNLLIDCKLISEDKFNDENKLTKHFNNKTRKITIYRNGKQYKTNITFDFEQNTF